ncbi:MAG TPA: response regulator [Burkholderiaceae bacterium]
MACTLLASQAQRSGRVLVADDNTDLRQYVQRLLADQYEVEVVVDGIAALEAARARRPDVIVSDVMMPRLDGFGLIQQLRQDPALSDIPVLVLSARAGEEARLEGLSRGADDYLVKPFSARELQGRVAALRGADDIRRRALDALRVADQRKNEFLATLSHELRNPLAPLRNALHLIRFHSNNPPAMASARDVMERQLNSLVRLVDDLLEMSRITSGSLELKRETVELSSVVRNATETSEPVILAGHHRLDISLPGEPLWIEGDPVRLAQILSNLLNNAAKYTPDGGVLALTAQRERGWVVLTVRDNGIGIAPDGLTRIFEMFSREGRGVGRAAGGLGIGLTLSRRLAEMHGGTIEARSAGVGLGSEFVVRLPAVALGAQPAPERKPAGLREPVHVLVVDDNRDAAESLGKVLELLGATVTVAYDGPSAVEAFGATDAAVVLLDIGLPGMSGYEVARAMRSRHPQRRPYIIAVTGWGQEGDRRKAAEAGIDHHLVKPADIDRLQELLDNVAQTAKGAV